VRADPRVPLAGGARHLCRIAVRIKSRMNISNTLAMMDIEAG
jgi:hypothetical protein